MQTRADSPVFAAKVRPLWLGGLIAFGLVKSSAIQDRRSRRRYPRPFCLRPCLSPLPSFRSLLAYSAARPSLQARPPCPCPSPRPSCRALLPCLALLPSFLAVQPCLALQPSCLDLLACSAPLPSFLAVQPCLA